MTIEDRETVDAIGLDRTGREVVLVISDHLDWTSPQPHLEALQEKIDTYLRLIESGEMVDTYPKARGRCPVTKVVGAHPLGPDGLSFFEGALAALVETGVDLRFSMLPEDRRRHR